MIDPLQRNAARRFNEHCKLVASVTNSLAVGVFLGAFLLPSTSAAAGMPVFFWLFASFATHMIRHVAVEQLVAEE